VRAGGARDPRPLPPPDRHQPIVIDRAKVRVEQRLDGKYLLSTSDPDLSAEDVALGYKNLLEAASTSKLAVKPGGSVRRLV
jgi:hypothetical protein